MKARKHIHEPFGRPGMKAPETRRCEWAGCSEAGEFKAPRDRRLREYMWLCLEHVRAYNKSWNYYAGMSEREVEEEIRRDTCWQRPSWKLGTLGSGRFRWDGARVKDGFGVFEEGFDGRHHQRHEPPRRAKEETEAERALRIMDLELPLSKAELKARYKALVKIHHPDVNRGDKAAEERLKDINEAYKTLLNGLNA